MPTNRDIKIRDLQAGDAFRFVYSDELGGTTPDDDFSVVVYEDIPGYILSVEIRGCDVSDEVDIISSLRDVYTYMLPDFYRFIKTKEIDPADIGIDKLSVVLHSFIGMWIQDNHRYYFPSSFSVHVYARNDTGVMKIGAFSLPVEQDLDVSELHFGSDDDGPPRPYTNHVEYQFQLHYYEDEYGDEFEDYQLVLWYQGVDDYEWMYGIDGWHSRECYDILWNCLVSENEVPEDILKASLNLIPMLENWMRGGKDIEDEGGIITSGHPPVATDIDADELLFSVGEGRLPIPYSVPIHYRFRHMQIDGEFLHLIEFFYQGFKEERSGWSYDEKVGWNIINPIGYNDWCYVPLINEADVPEDVRNLFEHLRPKFNQFLDYYYKSMYDEHEAIDGSGGISTDIFNPPVATDIDVEDLLFGALSPDAQSCALSPDTQSCALSPDTRSSLPRVRQSPRGKPHPPINFGATHQPKYELTDEIIEVDGHTLHRIRALRDFHTIAKGKLGGFIESEDNLLHEDKCWVHISAMVYGNAKVYGDAQVFDRARASGNARIFENALVWENARVYGHAQVCGNAKIAGNTHIMGYAYVCSGEYVSRVLDEATHPPPPPIATDIDADELLFGISTVDTPYVVKGLKPYRNESSYSDLADAVKRAWHIYDEGGTAEIESKSTGLVGYMLPTDSEQRYGAMNGIVITIDYDVFEEGDKLPHYLATLHTESVSVSGAEEAARFLLSENARTQSAPDTFVALVNIDMVEDDDRVLAMVYQLHTDEMTMDRIEELIEQYLDEEEEHTDDIEEEFGAGVQTPAVGVYIYQYIPHEKGPIEVKMNTEATFNDVSDAIRYLINLHPVSSPYPDFDFCTLSNGRSYGITIDCSMAEMKLIESALGLNPDPPVATDIDASELMFQSQSRVYYSYERLDGRAVNPESDMLSYRIYFAFETRQGAPTWQYEYIMKGKRPAAQLWWRHFDRSKKEWRSAVTEQEIRNLVPHEIRQALEQIRPEFMLWVTDDVVPEGGLGIRVVDILPPIATDIDASELIFGSPRNRIKFEFYYTANDVFDDFSVAFYTDDGKEWIYTETTAIDDDDYHARSWYIRERGVHRDITTDELPYIVRKAYEDLENEISNWVDLGKEQPKDGIFVLEEDPPVATDIDAEDLMFSSYHDDDDCSWKMLLNVPEGTIVKCRTRTNWYLSAIIRARFTNRLEVICLDISYDAEREADQIGTLESRYAFFKPRIEGLSFDDISEMISKGREFSDMSRYYGTEEWSDVSIVHTGPPIATDIDVEKLLFGADEEYELNVTERNYLARYVAEWNLQFPALVDDEPQIVLAIHGWFDHNQGNISDHEYAKFNECISHAAEGYLYDLLHSWTRRVRLTEPLDGDDVWLLADQVRDALPDVIQNACMPPVATDIDSSELMFASGDIGYGFYENYFQECTDFIVSLWRTEDQYNDGDTRNCWSYYITHDPDTPEPVHWYQFEEGDTLDQYDVKKDGIPEDIERAYKQLEAIHVAWAYRGIKPADMEGTLYSLPPVATDIDVSELMFCSSPDTVVTCLAIHETGPHKDEYSVLLYADARNRDESFTRRIEVWSDGSVRAMWEYDTYDMNPASTLVIGSEDVEPIIMRAYNTLRKEHEAWARGEITDHDVPYRRTVTVSAIDVPIITQDISQDELLFGALSPDAQSCALSPDTRSSLPRVRQSPRGKEQLPRVGQSPRGKPHPPINFGAVHQPKYELTAVAVEIDGRTLYRIRALRDFSDVKKGDIGGFIESEDNLSHKGTCWVYGNAAVYGDARVLYDAHIQENARVYDNARIYDDTRVFGAARVFGDVVVRENAQVFGGATVCGKAHIYGSAKVYGGAWVYDEVRVYGDAWVHGGAKVLENARVYGNAKVYGNAQAFDSARIFDNARAFGSARVYDGARIFGNARVRSARVYGKAQVYGSARVYDGARVHNCAQVCGNAKIVGDTYVIGYAYVHSGIHSEGYLDEKTNPQPPPVATDIDSDKLLFGATITLRCPMYWTFRQHEDEYFLHLEYEEGMLMETHEIYTIGMKYSKGKFEETIEYDDGMGYVPHTITLDDLPYDFYQVYLYFIDELRTYAMTGVKPNPNRGTMVDVEPRTPATTDIDADELMF